MRKKRSTACTGLDHPARGLINRRVPDEKVAANMGEQNEQNGDAPQRLDLQISIFCFLHEANEITDIASQVKLLKPAISNIPTCYARPPNKIIGL
jgi:hypothetical protein